MTWVDAVILAVIAISGLLALLRGLVREVLGIGAWVGAALLAIWYGPLLEPRFEAWLGGPDLAAPAGFAAVFIVGLIVLGMISAWTGSLVRASMLGGLDRTLGLVFGLARGAALVVFAYIAAGMVVPIDRWPAPVLQARSLPLVYEGAVWVTKMVPPRYQPRLYAPPGGTKASAADLMQPAPQGRAFGPQGRN